LLVQRGLDLSCIDLAPASTMSNLNQCGVCHQSNVVCPHLMGSGAIVRVNSVPPGAASFHPGR
jgi:polyferredoxin